MGILLKLENVIVIMLVLMNELVHRLLSAD